ncbi:MAG: ribonuclease HI family protein [Candidatus Methylomirabilales bacterium]
MDAVELRAILRRLSRAKPGDGVLQLPANLSPEDALRALRAALKALGAEAEEARPAAPPAARAAATGLRVHPALRVHIDGGSRGNPGPAGIGVVVLTPEGEVVERLHHFIGQATNNTAEYRALLLALERVLARGCREVEVLSDSELLVRQLLGQYQVRHPDMRRLYAQAQEQIGKLGRFTIRHIPRAQNAEADALANRAMDEGCRALLAAERRQVGEP